MAAGGHEIQIGRDAGLGGLDVGEILTAGDDPELLVATDEVQDLFLVRKNHHRGEAHLCAQGHDGLRRVTDFASGLGRGRCAPRQERQGGDERQRSCHRSSSYE